MSHQNLIETVCFFQFFLQSSNPHSAVPVFFEKGCLGYFSEDLLTP